jgi:hypothetical protein
MSAEYYYLVAGLPDIVQGVPKKGLLYETVLEEIRTELVAEDKELLARLQWRYDCENLISILNDKDEFDPRGFYSKDELQEGVTSLTGLPKFMIDFLDARRDGKALFANLGEKEQLLAGYFKEGMNNANRFISEWVTFELNLGNVIAAKSAKLLGLPVEKSVIPLNDTAEKIAKSSANDFGIGGEFDWLDMVISNFDKPKKLELALDDVRWKIADQIAEMDYFSIEALLAFTVKLNSVARWMALDPEKGAQKVEELLKGMQSAATAAQEKN